MLAVLVEREKGVKVQYHTAGLEEHSLNDSWQM